MGDAGRYQAQTPAARFCLLCVPRLAAPLQLGLLHLRTSRFQSRFIEPLATPWLQPGSLWSDILASLLTGFKPRPPV